MATATVAPFSLPFASFVARTDLPVAICPAGQLYIVQGRPSGSDDVDLYGNIYTSVHILTAGQSIDSISADRVIRLISNDSAITPDIVPL